MKNGLVRISVIMLVLVAVLSTGAGCGKKGTASTPASPDKPPVQSYSGGLVTAVANAGTEQKRIEAVEEVVSQGFSLGLLDEKGKQLNKNVPENAVSLGPVSVANYANLANGSYFRTVEYVVGFLADAGVQLESTGATITVKDFLLELQAYVNRSFIYPDDPKSVLGMMIASGVDMKVPASAPTITGQTTISPLCSLMIMGDVLIGIEGGEKETSAAKNSWFTKKALADTGSDKVVQNIKGLITTIKPLLSLVGSLLPGKAQNMIAAFEICDRLSVRMWEVPASSMVGYDWPTKVSATLPVAKNLKLEKGKKESVTVLGGVGIMSGVIGNPPETLEGVQTAYRFQLLSTDEQGFGVTLYDDADAGLRELRATANFTYSADLNGHRLLAQGNGNPPFKLEVKNMTNVQTRKALLHASARIVAPEDIQKLAEQKVNDKIKNLMLNMMVSSALDKLPWSTIKETMALMNRDFQPTPWMCTVEFAPVEKKTTTSTATTKPQTSTPEIKITSPKDGAVFMEGENIIFSVTTFDQFGKPMPYINMDYLYTWSTEVDPYFTIFGIGNGEFNYTGRLDKGTHTFTVHLTHHFGGDTGNVKMSDSVKVTIVPEQLSPLQTLFKKNIWHMEMLYNDTQIKPQSDYEMTFKEGGTFSYLNTSWKGTWSGDGSAIKMEFNYDYGSGPNMIKHWEFTGTLILAADGDYRNAVLKGDFKVWNEWEKDKSMKTGTWTAK
jgi:hypothetical protein